MRKYLNPNIQITEDGDDIPLDINLNNEKHQLSVEINKKNADVHLNFSSRVAMYDFARNLLHEAIYGKSEYIELLPLAYEGELLLSEGVRLTMNSSRVFIYSPVDE